MIHFMVEAICRWGAANHGIYPARIRVSAFVMRAIEKDFEQMQPKHDPKITGGSKLMGVPIEEDGKVFFAEADSKV